MARIRESGQCRPKINAKVILILQWTGTHIRGLPSAKELRPVVVIEGNTVRRMGWVDRAGEKDGGCVGGTVAGKGNGWAKKPLSRCMSVVDGEPVVREDLCGILCGVGI